MEKRERKDMMGILLRIANDENADVKLTRHGIKAFFIVSRSTLYFVYLVINYHFYLFAIRKTRPW